MDLLIVATIFGLVVLSAGGYKHYTKKIRLLTAEDCKAGK